MFRRPENRQCDLTSDKPIKETVNMNELTSLMQTEAPGIVGETLDFCLYECSIEDAPDAEEVAQWRDILKVTGVEKFVRLVRYCQTWLDEEADK